LTALTDKDGNVKERQTFDPWGNRRNPDDWTSLITTPVSHITGRGYTMHEHLDDFALINMNGRVYDPQIARFLSPDPQLQAPGVLVEL
jgi:RHS repeat-associated protein